MLRMNEKKEDENSMLDYSPFGCRTGFHLILCGEHDPIHVAKALKGSLKFIANEATWDDVQGTTIECCGNYRDHQLFSAKECSKKIVEEGIGSDPFDRKVVQESL
ncbi:hypothetical protein EWH99_10445 [Sporolactobacillus sp. THM7-7]|nr:hypothetical protein EWH99_10445 [Sporolactobacillus sp. THM7-7]